MANLSAVRLNQLGASILSKCEMYEREILHWSEKRDNSKDEADYRLAERMLDRVYEGWSVCYFIYHCDYLFCYPDEIIKHEKYLQIQKMYIGNV